MKRWLLMLSVLAAFLVFGSVMALAADQPASPPTQKDEVVGCGGGSVPAEQAAPTDQDEQADADRPSMMGYGMMGNGMMGGGMMGMMSFGMMGANGGCCGSVRDDGWFLEVLRRTDPAELKAALGKLDADPDAKALMATKEAGIIRQIIETGKLPELSLEDLSDLSRSPNTVRMIRALYGLMSVQRTLRA